MNEVQRSALRDAAANAADDEARARLQKRANPDWRSGNGTSIDELIDAYATRKAALLEGLEVTA